MKEYSIPRKEACEIAWISLRTLDRYVTSQKIDYKKIKWRVLFSEEDLKKIKLDKNIDILPENNKINSNIKPDFKTNFNFKKEKIQHKTSRINNFKNLENTSEKNLIQNNFWENFWEIVKMIQITAERDSFKKMLEISNLDLKEKQNQLERANFKLWEVLAKQNISLLENKQKSQEILNLQKKLDKSEEITKSLKDEISFQKFIKTVFIIILLLTVSILSFWYVYNFKI